MAMQIHNSDKQKTFLLVSAAEMSRETVNLRSVNASMKYSEIAYGQICSYSYILKLFMCPKKQTACYLTMDAKNMIGCSDLCFWCVHLRFEKS